LHLSAGSPQRTSIDEISLCGCISRPCSPLKWPKISDSQSGHSLRTPRSFSRRRWS